MLELHKIIRVSHAFRAQLFLFCFMSKVVREGVFKFMKNDHFLVHLAVLIFFPKFLGRLRSGLC